MVRDGWGKCSPRAQALGSALPKETREEAHADRIAHATLQAAFAAHRWSTHRARHPPLGLLHPVLGTLVGRNARHAALRSARRQRSPFPPPQSPRGCPKGDATLPKESFVPENAAEAE